MLEARVLRLRIENLKLRLQVDRKQLESGAPNAAGEKEIEDLTSEIAVLEVS